MTRALLFSYVEKTTGYRHKDVDNSLQPDNETVLELSRSAAMVPLLPICHLSAHIPYFIS